MDINPDAPGNISQKGVNSDADNETGFEAGTDDRKPSPVAGQQQGDDEPKFDPESPDVSDPAVDPLHPARTSNDPVPSGKRTDQDPLTSAGRGL